MGPNAQLERAREIWGRWEARWPRVTSLLQVLAVAGQLGLIYVIVRKFQVETQSLEALLLVALGGFVVHSQLPRPARLPFFIALSFLAIVVVLGPVNALWLLGIGGVLIGLCHLPIAFGARVALVLVAGFALMAMRSAAVPSPVPEAVWPILGSIFMFRMALYLYELGHGKKPTTPALTLSYFFMLPNVCFPLFPVVDYNRFRDNYYSEDEHRIYQRGVLWMFRGVAHLLIYRIVYQNALLTPADVATTANLVEYALGAFFLYLRVSGYFHLVAGMLLLFGFNLPETHHLYFFSSSFSDFWRRINIYWKDFMMKLFYYPAYFRLKRFGPTKALVLSTVVVFAGTWALHSYQWFWLRGSWLFEAHDALFWSILGVAMIGNSLYEERYGRRRTLPGHRPPPLARAAVALRTMATFTVLCTLWSLWSSDSLSQWLELWTTTGSLWLAPVLAVAVAALLLAAAGLDRLADRRKQARPREPVRRRAKAAPFFFWAEAVPTAAGLAVLAVLSWPQVTSRMGETVEYVAESARSQRLNERDAGMLERGYYEHLIAVNQQSVELWKRYKGVPDDAGPLTETVVWRERDDWLLGEFIPNAQMTWVGEPFHVNRWGIRDRDYALEKPPGTFRIALLGSSYTYGRGVGDADVFDHRLEERLNAERDGGARYEVLNFAAHSRNNANFAHYMRETIAPFEPDVVIQFATTRDVSLVRTHMVKLAERVAPEEVPDPRVRAVLEEALDGGRAPPRTILERRLTPLMEDFMAETYGDLAAEVRRIGAVPVFALMPLTHERSADLRAAARQHPWIEAVRDAGFEVLDIADLWDGRSSEALVVASWDDHPNARGHQLIADRVFEALAARPRLTGGDGTPPAALQASAREDGGPAPPR